MKRLITKQNPPIVREEPKYQRVTYEDSASLSMEYRQERIRSVFRPRPNIFLKEE